ncbi:MAG: GxxExxY protein [Phycisphaerae bacterium]|nr:GxxExxY protein [Phycisphaerae bacterium]
MAESDLLHADLTHKIIGAAMEVHRTLGTGFLEAVYEDALAVELRLQGICYEKQRPLCVFYKGHKVRDYICDFLVENTVLVELKAIKRLTVTEESQLLNYLKGTGLELGLLINFGETSLKYKRFIKTNPCKSAKSAVL